MISSKKSLKSIDRIIEILKEEVKRWESPVVSKVKRDGDPFKVLVSTVLSARTKDVTTWRAVGELFKRVKDVHDLDAIPLSELEDIIKPVGFYRNKAKNLKKLAKVLIDKYDGKVPDDFSSLIKLPGVGRKTANLVLSEVFDRDAICVDIHVHRISNRLGWVSTRRPEETEEELKKVLPRRYWKIINKLLVMYGQNLCRPVKPKCEECRLREFCSYHGGEV